MIMMRHTITQPQLGSPIIPLHKELLRSIHFIHGNNAGVPSIIIVKKNQSPSPAVRTRTVLFEVLNRKRRPYYN